LTVNLGCLVLQALLEHWPPTFVNAGEVSMLLPVRYEFYFLLHIPWCLLVQQLLVLIRWRMLALY